MENQIEKINYLKNKNMKEFLLNLFALEKNQNNLEYNSFIQDIFYEIVSELSLHSISSHQQGWDNIQERLDIYWDIHFPEKLKKYIDKTRSVSLSEKVIFYIYDQFSNKFPEYFVPFLTEKAIHKLFSNYNMKNLLNFSLKIIEDKKIEYFNHKNYGSLNLLEIAVISNHTGLVDFILTEGYDPKTINNDNYATSYVNSIQMAKTLDKHQVPWYNTKEDSAINLLYNKNYLEQKRKDISKYIVNKVKEETNDKNIGLYYCFDYFLEAPFKKYYKKFYSLMQLENPNISFTYDQKKASLLEHCLVHIIKSSNGGDRDTAKINAIGSLIERKNVSITQKDSNNTFTLLAYINFAHEIYKDLHDQKRNAAAINLFNDTLKAIKKKTLNLENLNITQFEIDLRFSDQINLKEKLNINSNQYIYDFYFTRSMNLYKIYESHINDTPEQTNKTLHILIDYLFNKENEIKNDIDNTPEEKQNRHFINKYNHLYQQNYFHSRGSFTSPNEKLENMLHTKILNSNDPLLINKYYNYQLLILNNIAQLNKKTDNELDGTKLIGLPKLLNETVLEKKDMPKKDIIYLIKSIDKYNTSLAKHSQTKIISLTLDNMKKTMETKVLKKSTVFDSKKTQHKPKRIL